MRVLYINDDPTEYLLREAFQKSGIEIELLVAKKEEVAREYLAEADAIDVVFMDYDMGRGKNTIETGLVQAFVDSGFGEGKKMLVAHSRSERSNSKLLDAGCSHETHPSDTADFVFFQIAKLK